MMFADSAPLFNAIGPKLRHDARHEHRCHADLSGSEEFVGTAVSNEDTVCRWHAESLDAACVDRQLRLDEPDLAREHRDVKKSSKWTLGPRRDFHDIGVADQTQAKSGRPKRCQGVDVLCGNAGKRILETPDSYVGRMLNAIVRDRRVYRMRQGAYDRVGISLFTRQAPT